MKRLRRRDERGSILLLTAVLSLVFIFAMASAVATTLNVGKHTQFELDRVSAVSIAEAVTEIARKDVLERTANLMTPPSSGTVSIGGVSHTYTVAPVGSPRQETGADGVPKSIQNWIISCEVVVGKGVAAIDRIIDVTTIPLFAYTAFYEGDLELNPAADMTLRGRVHTNGDMFLSPSNLLTIDSDSVTATGTILRRRKQDGAEGSGQVDIRVQGDTTYQTLTNDLDGESTGWTQHALDTWLGGVQDASHGVRSTALPDRTMIEATDADGNKGYYHEKADLVIVDGQGFDSAGNPVDVSAAVTERTIYDAREGTYVLVTDIDVAALGGAGQFPTNGLVYAYRTDASTAQPNGVRLVNGAELAAPLSVVSENPVYVQGDYNTVNKKAASVVADALNLLSNSWTDGGGTMQAAADTTYNLAFATGHVATPDGGGTYSGGLENLPRFHEDWAGARAAINGSFVQLFDSQFATSPWGGSGVYSAPVRDWSFDPDLLSNLPPFTPVAVSTDRVVWDDRMPLPFN